MFRHFGGVWVILRCTHGLLLCSVLRFHLSGSPGTMCSAGIELGLTTCQTNPSPSLLSIWPSFWSSLNVLLPGICIISGNFSCHSFSRTFSLSPNGSSLPAGQTLPRTLGCWGLNLAWLGARQGLYPLYYLSGFSLLTCLWSSTRMEGSVGRNLDFLLLFMLL